MKMKHSHTLGAMLIFLLLYACEASPQLTVPPTATNLPPTSTPTEIPQLQRLHSHRLLFPMVRAQTFSIPSCQETSGFIRPVAQRARHG